MWAIDCTCRAGGAPGSAAPARCLGPYLGCTPKSAPRTFGTRLPAAILSLPHRDVMQHLATILQRGARERCSRGAPAAMRQLKLYYCQLSFFNAACDSSGSLGGYVRVLRLFLRIYTDMQCDESKRLNPKSHIQCCQGVEARISVSLARRAH